jgi:hypothetical protein
MPCELQQSVEPRSILPKMRRVRNLQVDLESVELQIRQQAIAWAPGVISFSKPVLSRLRPLPAKIVLVRLCIPNHKFVDRVTRLKSGSQPPGLFPTPGPGL